jgi:acetoin utilization protein AcuB
MIDRLKNIPVDEFTSRAPEVVFPETPYAEICEIMRCQDIRHLPVVEGKKVVGIISDRNLKLPSDIINHLTAKDIMVKNPYSVALSDSLESVAFEMSKHKIGSAVVNDGNGELAGIFTTTDALNALIEVIRGDLDQ